MIPTNFKLYALFLFIICTSCLKSDEEDSNPQSEVPFLSKEELTKVPPGFKLNIDKLYYINLDRSTQRRIHFEHAYKRSGLKLTRHPAVLGSVYTYDKKKPGLQILDKEKNYTYEYDKYFSGGRGLSPGEIGNYLSHYQLVEIAAKSKNPVLIMEDDAEPIDDFKLRLTSAMAHLPEDWDILYLYCNSSVNYGCHTKNTELTSDRRFLHMKNQCTAGNVAYVLNSQGAQKLLKNAFPIRKTTDDRISEDIYGGGVPFKSYCLYPEIVKTEVDGPSSIINKMGRKENASLPCRESYKFLNTDVPRDDTRNVLILPRKFHQHPAYFLTYMVESLSDKGWEVYDEEDLNEADLQVAINKIKPGPPVDILLFFLGTKKKLDEWKRLPSSATKLYFVEDIHFKPETDTVETAYSKIDAFLTRYSQATLNTLQPKVPMCFDLPHGAAPPFLESNNNTLKKNKALISGAVDQEYYKLRTKALEDVIKHKPELLDHYQHPGYETTRNPVEIAIDYAQVLAEYKIAISGTLASNKVRAPYVLAKHFEIPAVGSVVLTDAWLEPYLKQYGMHENEHYIASTVEDLEPSLEFWLAPEQKNRLDRIAKKGQKFVKDKFNLEKQMEELDSKIRKFHAHMRQPIPKKVHQIWVGSDQIPDYVSIYKESFDKYLPDFEYRLWTNKDLTRKNFPRTFNTIHKIIEVGIRKYGRDDSNWNGAPRRVLAEIADLMRYEIIFREGGLYFDTKFEITGSFESYIKPGISFIVANEEGVCGKNCEFISNAFFGSIPEHPIFENLISESALNRINFEKDAPNVATGPFYLRKGIGDRDVTYIPSEKIYPFITWKGYYGRNPEKDRCLFHEKPNDLTKIREITHRGQTLYAEFPCTKYPATLAVTHAGLGQSWH